MGYSSDGLPHVGRRPGCPNQYIIAGFTGHGMPQVFLSAKGVAEMVIGGKEFKDTGVPRVFETTGERLKNTENVILDGWKASHGEPVAKL